MNKQTSQLDLQEKKKVMINYIFNEDDVHKTKTFTQNRYDDENFGYGLFLPKNVPVTNKTGEIVSQEQVWNPVLITSTRNIIEVTKEMEQDHKIKFDVIPENLKLRWNLESLKEFLEDNETIPELEPQELFEKIEKQYEKYIYEHNPIWNKINALWDMGTYVYSLFDSYPLSEKRGLQETAKSKRMEVSQNLSFNATEIMINPSEATLFRETHEKRPTKYFDEAEKLFKWIQGKMEPDNRVELINGSYKKGSSVPRVEKIGNRFKVVYYKTYSPCMIASIRGLYGATESRCITQICTRSPDNDARGETEIIDSDSEWALLRDYLYLFSLRYWKEIENNYREEILYKDLKLKKRDLQLWKPLLSIAILISEKLFSDISEFAEKISGQRREEFISEESLNYRILKIVKDLLQDTDIIRPKEIRKQFSNSYGLEDSPKEKTISTILNNLGFREFKEKKDMHGVKYRIDSITFDSIINPICPELTNYSSYSSYSSSNKENKENSNDELVKKYDE